MFKYTKILFTGWLAVGGIIIRALWPQGGGRVLDDLLSALVLNAPSHGWLMFYYGVGVGLFIIPFIISWIEKDREFEKFYNRLGSESLAKAKAKFFRNLSRAYYGWVSLEENAGAPPSLQKAIDAPGFPDWAAVLCEQSLNIDDINLRFAATNSHLWKFISRVSADMDGYVRRREESTLLHETELDELDDARQTLSYFLDDTAKKLIRRRQLRLRNIRDHIDISLLKVLSYMEIENHKRISGAVIGGQYIIYLGAICLKMKPWGGWQSIWNPCLTTSENLRT